MIFNKLGLNNHCFDCLETRTYCLEGLACLFLIVRAFYASQKLVEKVLKCKTKKFFNFIFLYEKFKLYSYKKINKAKQCKSSNHYSI